MNRRAFFGFAAGGVVAAPLALVGEKGVPTVHSSNKNIQEIVITVDAAGFDERIQKLVQEGVRQAHQAHMRGLDPALRSYSMLRG